mmetsp:Transcript_1530/g.2296  ORF Transcript_1530/g.2296 Transcript_1530/m.2296 type:complete len:151 (-) Transcript_1530:230-682(-)
MKKASKEASKLGNQVKNMERGLGCLGFIGGVLTAGASFLGMMNILNPLGFVVEAYTFLFGIAIALIEMQNQCLPLSFLERWARFMTTLGGRGVFYVYVGSLSIAKSTFLSFAVGAYMMGVGCLYIISVCRSSSVTEREMTESGGAKGTPV